MVICIGSHSSASFCGRINSSETWSLGICTCWCLTTECGGIDCFTISSFQRRTCWWPVSIFALFLFLLWWNYWFTFYHFATEHLMYPWLCFVYLLFFCGHFLTKNLWVIYVHDCLCFWFFFSLLLFGPLINDLFVIFLNRSNDPYVLELDFEPFNAAFPRPTRSSSIGNGVQYLNRHLSSNMFRNKDTLEPLLDFLRVHKYKGHVSMSWKGLL